MLVQELIRAKRFGEPLTRDQITAFVDGIAGGDVSDAQMAAFAMAVCVRGMAFNECVALTEAMRDSGDCLNWSRLGSKGPVIDKHSTGGVGDNVSLILAPLLAACGAYVPMVSGRGLAHTGGTLDKLDAIPGYQTQPALEIFQHAVEQAGCAIAGATQDIAPADKALYAVRDVTATVDSVPLITASILAKKLAAGLDALVLDIKTGNGAFMTELADAEKLAESLTATAKESGLPARALITQMNQPLATAAGNAIELSNALSVLKGERQEPRLMQVVNALGNSVLVLSGLAVDAESAMQKLDRALSSGEAAERFNKMVAALGGPHDFVDQPDYYLAQAPIIQPVIAERDGQVDHIDTRALGLLVVELGAGRTHADDYIDYAVGLDDIVPLGAKLSRGDIIATVHARDPSSVDAATATLRRAIHISETLSLANDELTRAVVLKSLP